MAEPTQVNLARDLLIIHRIATRAIQVGLDHSLRFVASGFPDDSTREGFFNFIRSLSIMLHSHHTGEDDITFPELRVRIPTAPVDTLCAEHQQMQTVLEQINHQLDRAAGGQSDQESLSSISAQMEQLREIWARHIPVEEEVLTVKRIREVFKEYEEVDMQRKLSEHGIKTSQPDYLLLPFMLYNLSPEDRMTWSRMLPPVVTQELVPVVWKDKWISMQPFLLM